MYSLDSCSNVNHNESFYAWLSAILLYAPCTQKVVGDEKFVEASFDVTFETGDKFQVRATYDGKFKHCSASRVPTETETGNKVRIFTGSENSVRSIHLCDVISYSI